MSAGRLGLVLLFAAACDIDAAEAGTESWSIESTPADATRDVARAESLRVQLDRRVLPRSVVGAVRLRSGAFEPPLELRYELLHREILVIFPAWAPLAVETSYRLEVAGLVDLDGLSQPNEHTAYFRTGSELGEPPPLAAAPDVADVLQLLAERCASSGCHVEPALAAGLDLASASGIERSAFGTSAQLELGTLGEQQGAAGVLWKPATRIIDITAGRGDPASSYLMYKVLGDAHIVGDVMPPRGSRLQQAELTLLSDWIRSGAPTRDP